MPEQPEATLTCPTCGFSNPADLTFCQDCGARLPAAPSFHDLPPPTVPVETPAAVHVPPPARRGSWTPPVRKGPPAWKGFLGTTVRTLVYAAIAAGLIQLLRPPADLPPPVGAYSQQVVDQVLLDLRARASRGGSMELRWPSLNSYLAARLPQEPGHGLSLSRFQRIAVGPGDGGMKVFFVRKILGIPTTTWTAYGSVTRGNGVDLQVLSAGIGRVPLPAWLSMLTGPWDTDLETRLDAEISQSSRISTVEIAPGGIRIQFIRL